MTSWVHVRLHTELHSSRHAIVHVNPGADSRGRDGYYGPPEALKEGPLGGGGIIKLMAKIA